MPIEFPDAIHGRLRIPEVYRSIIESPPLARLRNVKQLGFTPSMYSGAVHTRFEHTLGTLTVLDGIFKIFGYQNTEAEYEYRLAALLSEIGIFPLSYSSRMVFNRLGHDKKSLSSILYKAFLETAIGVPSEQIGVLANPESPKHDWFREIISGDEFPELTPIRLASTIDYVLRDGYFSGRYPGIFDYRHFRSLKILSHADDASEVRDALHDLFRSAHALNVVYGGRERRLLTHVLDTLLIRLESDGFISPAQFVEPHRFVELDDDTFLSLIADACQRAKDAGDAVAEKMFKIITQRVPMHIKLTERFWDSSADVDLVRAEVACAEEVDPDAIVVLGGSEDDRLIFRIFGREFGSYEDAMRSDYFRRLAGVDETREKIAVSKDDRVIYVII